MTYVIRDVGDRDHRPVGFGGHDKRKVPLVYLDINMKGRAKSHDFHVVSVGTPAGHFFQMALKRSIDFRRGRLGIGKQ